jgi:hydrogenase-4 component B
MLGLVLVCAAALLVNACAAAAFSQRPDGARRVYAICLGLCVLLVMLALGLLFDPAGQPATLLLPIGLPRVGMHFNCDSLSAVFLVIVNLAGAAASLYGLGLAGEEPEPYRVLVFFPAFLAGMTLVVLAADAFTFLVAWEFMSLASWALVNAHHHESRNTRAGYVYLLMASFGTLALLLAFGLLAGPDGHYDFAAMRAGAVGLQAPAMVFLLVLAGAGSKAGLVPLHVWLPLAHPAAPSHVSALMSAAMTKVAIYGFIRIVFDLLGPPPVWWSIVIIVIGGLSALLGVLNATMQRDLKKLLAHSTVENVGIIFVALGLALAFKANGMAPAAALALTAGLLHCFNHALFKSLLFLGAGAVLRATGERDIERLGGLIHRMPHTSFAFLGGCMAIAALPPLNGFASEWLIFQSILRSPDLPQWGLKLLAPAAGVVLALSAALAAGCFVRAFGITFLGRARTAAADRAREVGRAAQAAMVLLLALCLLAGVLPGLFVDALAGVCLALTGATLPPQAGIAWLSIVPVADGRNSYNGLLVFAFIAMSALAAVASIHRFASRRIRRAAAWDCGFPDADPATQYSAASFAQPIRRVYGEIVFAVDERLHMPAPGALSPARLDLVLNDRLWQAIYRPLIALVSSAARRLNHLQFLTIRAYLSLVFAALVGLLFMVAVWA